MLHCEYCDYCKKTVQAPDRPEGQSSSFCRFTGHILAAGETQGDGEYPCKDMSYQEYLNKSKVRKAPAPMTGDSWKLPYKKQHPVPEKKRSATAV